MRLAYRLGIPLYRLHDELPAWEVHLWAEFLSKEPDPLERIEHGIASLQCLYVNAHKQKGKKPSKPADFLPWKSAWDAEPEQTPEALAMSLGGMRTKRKDRGKRKRLSK